MELIEKLKHHIKYHIRPYNLGDKGETETLILELIRKYEAAQQSLHPTLWILPLRVALSQLIVYPHQRASPSPPQRG